MGAWIETRAPISIRAFIFVAPYMGAWIETDDAMGSRWLRGSRALYGCVD